MKQPKHKRSKAQQAAARKWAAAGRAAQARKRAYNVSHHLPTRSNAQKQAALKWAAAGRAAQARKRSGQPPAPKKKAALAGGLEEYHSLTQTARDLMVIARANRAEPCCAATTLATHLYIMRGIIASEDEVLALHLAAAGGEEGAYLSDLLEVASSGFAGTRITRFWRVDDPGLPGIVARLQLPGGTHAALMLGGAACVSWGRVLPVAGECEEAWWAEWEI